MTDWSRLARSLRELPPPDAHACLGVRRFLADVLHVAPPWPLCVVGVSGGLDSSVLALVLHLIGVPLVLAHLDHGLRVESADDARHVTEYAAALGVPCVVAAVDVAAEAAAHGRGLEDAGRIARYALLERVRQQSGATWIMTGHHLDDLEEDVLLRLIRGGGWPALGGMAARDDARHLLRPLLHTPRAGLESLARAAHLPWREDASNAGRDFRRNRVRHDILPLIRAENPAFAQSVRRMWELAEIDAAYWEQTVGTADASPTALTELTALTTTTAPNLPRTLLVPRARLDGLLPAARLRLFLAGVRQVCRRGCAGAEETATAMTGRSGQARADALLDLERLWQARRTGAVVQMPGVIARITREGVLLSAT